MHRLLEEFKENLAKEIAEDFINIGTQIASYDYLDILWTFIYNCISIIKSFFFIFAFLAGELL